MLLGTKVNLARQNRHYDEQPVEDCFVTEDEVATLCDEMYSFAVEGGDESDVLTIKRITKRQLLSWNLLIEKDDKLIPSNGYMFLKGNMESFPQAQI